MKRQQWEYWTQFVEMPKMAFPASDYRPALNWFDGELSKAGKDGWELCQQIGQPTGTILIYNRPVVDEDQPEKGAPPPHPAVIPKNPDSALLALWALYICGAWDKPEPLGHNLKICLRRENAHSDMPSVVLKWMSPYTTVPSLEEDLELNVFNWSDRGRPPIAGVVKYLSCAYERLQKRQEGLMEIHARLFGCKENT